MKDMNNIWFLRTDIMTNENDISIDNPFIYSKHGVCADDNINNIESVIRLKKQIFPELSISGHDLRKTIIEIKEELIEEEIIDYEPKRCDYFIWCWICVMDIGDIVVVRNLEDLIFICEVSSYVSKEYFETYGYFGRSVRILKEYKESDDDIIDIKDILHRTSGRKTLERNGNSDVRKVIEKYVEGEVGSYIWKSN